jgi:hypothetical protein
MYLSAELERQQMDAIQTSGGNTSMHIGGGEKFLRNPPKIPEPTEYTIPQPKFVGNDR